MATLSPDTSANYTDSEQVSCGIQIDRAFLVLMLIPAIILLVICSFLKTRKACALSCCWKRPAMIYPINFGEQRERLWAYVAAFLVLAKRIMDLFPDGQIFPISQFNDLHWRQKYGWSIVFYKIFSVLYLCIIFMPLLVVILVRHHIVANVLGIVYIIPWVVEAVFTIIYCYRFGDDDQPLWEKISQFVTDVPFYICLIVLLAVYVFDLCTNIMRKRKEKTDIVEGKGKDQMKEPNHVLYVRQLLRQKSKADVTDSMKEKVKKKLTYEKIEGFKYTPRILFPIIIAALFLLQMTYALYAVSTALYRSIELLNITENLGINATVLSSDIRDSFNEYVTIFYVTYIISVTFSLLAHIVIMIHIVICYKRNMMKMQKGKYLREMRDSPEEILVSSMRYAGYQIAYLLYGFLIMFLLVWFLIGIISFLVVLPLRDGQPTMWAIEKIKDFWPTFVVGFAVSYGQKIIAKYAFLQEKGAWLALNNRRAYHVVDFVLFFLNVLVGIFSCLKRIVFSVILGAILISRLDQPLLMEGYTNLDSGYNAYMGMLWVDLTQNNPLLRTFVDILNDLKTTVPAKQSDEEGEESRKSEGRRKRARLRWYKAYTLVKTPSLVLEYLKAKIKNEQDRRHAMAAIGTAADTFVKDGGAGETAV